MTSLLFFLSAKFFPADMSQEQIILAALVDRNVVADQLGVFPSHTGFPAAEIVELWEGEKIKGWRAWLSEAEDVEVRAIFLSALCASSD